MGKHHKGLTFKRVFLVAAASFFVISTLSPEAFARRQKKVYHGDQTAKNHNVSKVRGGQTLTLDQQKKLTTFFSDAKVKSGIKYMGYIEKGGFKGRLGDQKVDSLLKIFEESRCEVKWKSLMSQADGFAQRNNVPKSVVLATMIARSTYNADRFFDTLQSKGQNYLAKGSNKQLFDQAKEGFPKCLADSLNKLRLNKGDVSIIKHALKNIEKYVPDYIKNSATGNNGSATGNTLNIMSSKSPSTRKTKNQTGQIKGQSSFPSKKNRYASSQTRSSSPKNQKRSKRRK